MVAQSSNVANAAVCLSQKVNKMTAGGSLDYNSWRSLILEMETACPEDIDTISLAYDAFLSTFPLCHWHLEKYAFYKAKLCRAEDAIKLYERGTGVAMYSVGFWVDYFSFAASCFGDPEDVRRLFRRAVSFVERDYYCHVLWDKHIKYEFNHAGWSFLALSYIQVLRFPTKKLHFYYDNFKQFVANLEEEIGLEKDNDMEVDRPRGPCASREISKDELSLIIKDLLDSSDRSIKSKALDRYRAIGEEFYQEACQMEEKVICFEKKILRRYFYVTPLDDDQLNNWHLYLDFIQELDNLDWAVKLYERCLIPCANYPEFWMRYVEFLESKGGRELAISTLDRAAHIFLKTVPVIHLFSARFKEQVGDANGARAALLLVDAKTDSGFIEKTVALANLEKRLGNFAAASATYEKALETAREKRRLHVLPTLYTHFAHLTFLISGSAAAARDVLIEGVRRVPHCRFLLEELIKFAMTHDGASHLNVIDAIIAGVVSPGWDEYKDLNAKDRENLSSLFLEYVNLCGTIHDVRKAWDRHVKVFPQFLRMSTTYKKPTSSNNLSVGVTTEKGTSDSAVQDHPSGNPSSGDHFRFQGQEQVLKPMVTDEIQPNKVLERFLPPQGNERDAEEPALREVSAEAIVLSKKDASWNNEPDHEVSRQSREDNLGGIVFSDELADQSKENAFSVQELDQDPTWKSAGGNIGNMDVRTELEKQSNENALIPLEREQEVGKSSETTELVQPSLEEFRQEKHPVFLDNSLNSQEMEPQESIHTPVDKNETQSGVPGGRMPSGISNADFDSFAFTKSIHTEHVSNKLVTDRSAIRQQISPTKRHADPDDPSNPADNLIEINNHRPPATRHTTPRFQEQSLDPEAKLEQSFYHDYHPADASGRTMSINLDDVQQNLDKQKSSPAQSGTVYEDKATDKDQPTSNMTPPTNVSSGQTPTSSQPVSYPLPNMYQITSPSSQYPWQTQQSLAMNQMLQYHYQQQQLLQQQYQQQQLQMQRAYFQLQQNYQQFYQQLQPQQHSQQQVQPMNQQQQQLQASPYHHQQQQQQGLQSSPYQVYQLQQNLPFFQQSQQHYQQNHQQVVGHMPVQQGQETPPNIQQTQTKQQQQAQDHTYQAHQLAYQQQASQTQQLLLQQYQQYQAYQHMQQQQQSQEVPNHMQEQHLHQHPVQRQQDEPLQQQLQVTNLMHMSQNQQGSRSAPPDCSDPAKPSESHLQSP